MAANVGLPPGFELDQVELPAGFELDQPAAQSPQGRTVVEPNAMQRRAGIRRARFKDENLAGNIGSGFMSLGEDVGRETIGALSNAGLSPSAANAGGALADAATNFIPMGVGAKAGAAVGEPIMVNTPLVGAKALMQQAIRPLSKALNNGTAAQAIDTMLAEGVNATTGGALKLRKMITELKGEVTKIINAQPGTLVSKAPVYKELQGLLDEVALLGKDAPTDAVKKAWDAFKVHPLAAGENTDIPLKLADDMKRAFQKSAKGAYGTTNPGLDDKIDMAIAAGMRKSEEAAAPAIAPFNAKMSEYLRALNLIEPRAAMEANKQLGGLVPLAPTAEQAMIMLADRNPWMKSYIARALYQSRRTAPAAVGAYIARPEEQ